jgi:predicted GNAT family N-acyltransferase
MANLSFKNFTHMTDCEYKLRYEVFVLEQKMLYAEEFENDEDKFTHCHIYSSEKLVACARLGQVKDGAIRIGRIAVKRNLRRHGLGTKIIQYAENIGYKSGYRKFFLVAQTYAQEFYEKIGYIADGKQFIVANIPHIMMKKIL